MLEKTNIGSEHRECAEYAHDKLESVSANECVADLFYALDCDIINNKYVRRYLEELQHSEIEYDTFCGNEYDAIGDAFALYAEYSQRDTFAYVVVADDLYDVVISNKHDGTLAYLETPSPSWDTRGALRYARDHYSAQLTALIDLAWDLSDKCDAANMRDRILGQHIELCEKILESLDAYADYRGYTL